MPTWTTTNPSAKGEGLPRGTGFAHGQAEDVISLVDQNGVEPTYEDESGEA